MKSPSRTWTSRPGRFLRLGLLVALAGCAGTRKHEVLESRLRNQEDMLARYESQLDRTKTELDIARRESASLREQLAATGTPESMREPSEAGLRATGIEFSTLMTGGLNLDGRPGDDGLSVVLIPEGPDGELVRVSGAVEIEAFDLSHPHGAERIGHWRFEPGESERHWHNGVIQSGYQFELPWQSSPRSQKVLLHGRLVAIDGRQFDTTYTIRVEPPESAWTERESPSARNGQIETTSAVSVNGSHQPAGVGANRSASPLQRNSAQPPFGHTQAPHPSRPVARAAPQSATAPGSPSRAAFDSDVPPPIQDTAADAEPGDDDADWFRQDKRPSVRTSDTWTGETIPYLR
ncbi:MAG: hypothetical protein AB7Q45_17770 [Planctomycetaceae bacterium]